MENKTLELAKAKDELIIDSDQESEERAYFHLKDSTHEFLLGLNDLLKCVKFAEDEGLVLNLTVEWWLAMDAEYHNLYGHDLIEIKDES